MLRSVIACLSLLLLVGAFPVSADDMGGPEPGGTPQRRTRSTPAPAPAAKAAPAASDEWKRNHVSIYMSSISDDDFSTTEFNGGVEYEYQFMKYAGIGVQVEGATGLRNMVALVPIFIHPWKGLRLTVGGGARLDRDNDHDGLLRVGLGYRFNITDSITLAPEYNADMWNLTDSTQVEHLFGVRLGYQF